MSGRIENIDESEKVTAETIAEHFDEIKKELLNSPELQEKIENLKNVTLEELKKGEIELAYADTIAASTAYLIDAILREPDIGLNAIRSDALAAIDKKEKEYITAIKHFLKDTNPPFKQRCREIVRAIGMLVGAIIGFLCFWRRCTQNHTPVEEKSKPESKPDEPIAESKADKSESTGSKIVKGAAGGAVGLTVGYYAASFFTRNTKKEITALADEAAQFCDNTIRKAKEKAQEYSEPEVEEVEEKSCCRCC